MGSLSCSVTVSGSLIKVNIGTDEVAIPADSDVDFTPLVKRLAGLIETSQLIDLILPEGLDDSPDNVKIAVDVIGKILKSYNHTLLEGQESVVPELASTDGDDHVEKLPV